MRICAMGDCHGVLLPPPEPVDVILLAGDLSMDAHHLSKQTSHLSRGHIDAQRRFALQDLAEYQASYGPVIAVCGNHDVGLDGWSGLKRAAVRFLNDELCELPDGTTVWGSPWTLGTWAYGERNESRIKRHWDRCPVGVDILLTHQPPYGIGDSAQGHIGSKTLRAAIDRIKPKLHLFGHCHEGRGRWQAGQTVCINCTLGWRFADPAEAKVQFLPWIVEEKEWKP